APRTQAPPPPPATARAAGPRCPRARRTRAAPAAGASTELRRGEQARLECSARVCALSVGFPTIDGVLSLALAAAGGAGAVRAAQPKQAPAFPRNAGRAVAEPRALGLRAAYLAARRVRWLLARPARLERRRAAGPAPVL